jgi:hypothetical protein
VEWQGLNDILMVLRPVRELTIRFQSEQLVAGQAFAYLKSCLISVKNMDNNFAKIFSPIFEKRAQDLLSEPSILASVFFDARFSCLLRTAERDVAVKYIISLNRYFVDEIGFPTNSYNNQGPVASCKTGDKISGQLKGNSDNLDDILDGLINESMESTEEEPLQNLDLEIVLSKFSRVQLLRSTNIFEFWENVGSLKEHEFHSLYNLATTCLALPVTQVSVERCFSTLKFILNDLRYNIDDGILEDILLVNLNKNLKNN